jgi:hypothetical protein
MDVPVGHSAGAQQRYGGLQHGGRRAQVAVPAGQIGSLGQDGFQVRRPRAGFPGLEVQAGSWLASSSSSSKAGRAGVVEVQVDQAWGRQSALAQLCDEGRDAAPPVAR